MQTFYIRHREIIKCKKGNSHGFYFVSMYLRSTQWPLHKLWTLNMLLSTNPDRLCFKDSNAYIIGRRSFRLMVDTKYEQRWAQRMKDDNAIFFVYSIPQENPFRGITHFNLLAFTSNIIALPPVCVHNIDASFEFAYFCYKLEN